MYKRSQRRSTIHKSAGVMNYVVAIGLLGFMVFVPSSDHSVGDVALLFGFDIVANVVTFFENLPGDIADETGEGDKEKLTLIHF